MIVKLAADNIGCLAQIDVIPKIERPPVPIADEFSKKIHQLKMK